MTSISVRFISITAIIAAVASGIQHGFLIGDPGVGWHLSIGRWIAERGEIPRIDPFLYPPRTEPYVATQWLSDLILWHIFQLAGFQGLNALVLSLGIAIFFFLVPNVLRNEAISPVLLSIVLLLGMVSWSIQQFVRPVVFSFLLFALVFLYVSRVSRDTSYSTVRYLLLVAVLFVLWANLHPGFPLGLLVVGAYAAQEAVKLLRGQDSRMSLMFLGLIVSSAATLITPYGWALHAGALDLVRDDFFRSIMAEWRSPDFQKAVFQPFLLQLTLLMVLGWCGKLRLSLADLLIVTVLLALSLESRRYIPFFAMAVTPTLARGLQEWLNRGSFARSSTPHRVFAEAPVLKNVPVPLVALVSTIILSFVGCGSLSRDFAAFSQWRPVEAIEAIANRNDAEPIFHSFDHGGYMIFRFYPERRAWLDDRNELNGRERYEEYFELSLLRPRWKEVVKKYGFRFFLLDIASPLATYLAEVHTMQEIFRDERYVVFHGSLE